MPLRKPLFHSVIAAALTATAITAAAQTPEEKGFEIAARSDRSDNGFGSSEVKAKMVLRNAAGQATSRSARFGIRVRR